MDGKMIENISAVSQPKINDLVGELNNNIRAFERKMSAKGLLKSGNRLKGLAELLIEHISKVIDIINDGIFNYIKLNDTRLNEEELSELVHSLLQQHIEYAEQRLDTRVSTISSDPEQKVRLLEKLDLRVSINNLQQIKISELNSRIDQWNLEKEKAEKANKIEKEKLDIAREANEIAKSAKKVSFWSIIISSGISIAALGISIYAIFK